MKKLLICLLAIGLCLCAFVGCKQDEDVPKGYKNATSVGDAFRFYIPSTWNPTVDYGVTGGYYNLSTTSVVRLKEYIRADGMGTEEFYDVSLRPAFLALADDLTQVEEPAAALLGSLDALRFHESGSVSGKKLQFLTYVGSAKENFYVLTFTSDDSVYDALLADVSGMAEVFTIADPYQSADKPVRAPNEKVDTPAGMQLASSDDVSYRFFVPDDWEFDSTISISEAHNKTNTANLTVVPYLPETTMTVSEFLSMQNGQLITAYGDGYEKLGEEEGALGARSANIVEYRIVDTGNPYRVRVYATAYKGMIYSFTYTATEEAYNLYLADVAETVAAFTFR